MRITVVSPYDPFPEARDAGAHVGGVERVLGEVSSRLAKRGHDVTLVCSSTGEGQDVPGVHIERVPRTGVVMRAPIAALAARIAGGDIIHVPATYPFTTPSVLRRANRLGVPSVLDFHFEPDPGTSFGRLAARAYRAIGPRSYALADAVLVRSHAYAERSPSLSWTDMARRHIIPNGIDPERFHPGPEPDDDGPILFVGRLVPYKGLDILLTALAMMPHAPPLVVIGEGPLRASLEAQARRLHVDATFLGAVDEDDLPGHFQRARLTVLPSVTKQECFGMTLLESMACGTPVVASALPGVAEVAALGGLTAPPGDAIALEATLRQALAPGALLRGRFLATPIHQAYSWDAVTDGLEAVYERILDPTPKVIHAHPRRDPVL